MPLPGKSTEVQNYCSKGLTEEEGEEEGEGEEEEGEEEEELVARGGGGAAGLPGLSDDDETKNGTKH